MRINLCKISRRFRKQRLNHRRVGSTFCPGLTYHLATCKERVHESHGQCFERSRLRCLLGHRRRF